MTNQVADEIQRIGDPSLGIIIPAVILLVSLVFTYLLYKKFSDK